METTITNDLLIGTFELKKAKLIFRAVNNKMRLQILHVLHKNGELTVTSIFTELGIEQSVVSQHLAILRKAGFVQTKRDVKYIHYSINYNRLNELHQIAGQFLEFK